MDTATETTPPSRGRSTTKKKLVIGILALVICLFLISRPVSIKTPKPTGPQAILTINWDGITSPVDSSEHTDFWNISGPILNSYGAPAAAGVEAKDTVRVEAKDTLINGKHYRGMLVTASKNRDILITMYYNLDADKNKIEVIIKNKLDLELHVKPVGKELSVIEKGREIGISCVLTPGDHVIEVTEAKPSPRSPAEADSNRK